MIDENAPFQGQPTRSIGNAHLRLDFLAHAGPRLVRLFVNGSQENLLAEMPDVQMETSFGPYNFRGGHRLWHAPEGMPRSYIPDNDGLEVTRTDPGLLLQAPVEPGTGIRKSVEIILDLARPVIRLRHVLKNEGLWPVELAAWALTQLPVGGLAIFPQVLGSLESTGLLPNRNLVLWPYTSIKDERFEPADDLLLVHAQPKLPPFKLGYLNRSGWMGYLYKGVYLRKRFPVYLEQAHVDFGCNAESFCNDIFIELETLSPLSLIQPGQSLEHTETWELFSGLDYPQTLAGARTLVKDLE